MSLIASLLIGFTAISLLVLAGSILIGDTKSERAKPTTPVKKSDSDWDGRPNQ